MERLVIGLIPLALVVSLIATALTRKLGLRRGVFDGAGVAGQVKEAARRVPNIGGIGIFLGLALPLAGGLLLFSGTTVVPNDLSFVPPDLAQHLTGLTSKAGHAWVILVGTLVLHLMGLYDDRRPLGPWVKLVVMLVVSLCVAWWTDTRLLTLFDARAGGSWLSLVLTVVWFAVVINAMNFLDNMDGLAAGVGLAASCGFLAVALLGGQWFVGAVLAVLAGALLGFLWFNMPPARIFMGDGGSLVVGFLLAFLSVRVTYAGSGSHAWHSVLTPLVILAVPLYDFASVVALRLFQKKSPFVGDLQHLSHRLVGRGLSKRAAVLVIVGITVVTALAGVALTRVDSVGAVLIGVQVGALLVVLGLLEFAPADSALRKSLRP